jgi:hypothetical protein
MRRLAAAMLLAGLTTAVWFFGLPAPAYAYSCWMHEYEYYSEPEMINTVGHWSISCNYQRSGWGEETPYYYHIQECCSWLAGCSYCG